jgi:hypothetical protein
MDGVPPHLSPSAGGAPRRRLSGNLHTVGRTPLRLSAGRRDPAADRRAARRELCRRPVEPDRWLAHYQAGTASSLLGLRRPGSLANPQSSSRGAGRRGRGDPRAAGRQAPPLRGRRAPRALADQPQTKALASRPSCGRRARAVIRRRPAPARRATAVERRARRRRGCRRLLRTLFDSAQSRGACVARSIAPGTDEVSAAYGRPRSRDGAPGRQIGMWGRRRRSQEDVSP